MRTCLDLVQDKNPQKITILKINFRQEIHRSSVNVLTDNGFSLTCYPIEIDVRWAKQENYIF